MSAFASTSDWFNLNIFFVWDHDWLELSLRFGVKTISRKPAYESVLWFVLWIFPWQILLLQTLSAENLKVLSTGSMGVSSKQSAKTSPTALNRGEGIKESPERIDSGFESTRTDLTSKFSKGRGVSHFNQDMVHNNVVNVPGFETETPWEVFLTGRKLTVAAYSRIPRDEKPAGKELSSSVKPSLHGRSKPVLIKPVLRVELVHPALTVNTHSSGPRIQGSCFDVSIAGASPTKGKL